MFKHRFFLLLFLSLFGVVSDALAVSDHSNTLSFSLEEALRIAYFNNPQMCSAREAVEAQKGRAVTQSSFRGPEARFEVGPENSLSSWEVTQAFDAPGALILKSQIAGDEIKIKEAELKALWADIYRRVKSVYAGVLFN